jgi:Zn-dependent peptidase ImmA (M78 family)
MIPTEKVLEALAKALNVDVTYFSRPMNDDIEKCQINFRKKSSMTKSESKALEAKVLDKVERCLHVRHIMQEAGAMGLPCPLAKMPVRTRKEARQRAAMLRREWGLGNEPISDVKSELEEHGIMVLLVDADRNFDGLSGTVANSNDVFIAINNNTPYVERRRLTTLHELGHQVMWLDGVAPKEQESLCNEFANEMLMPEKPFRDYLRKHFSESIIMLYRPLQMKYGISIDALMKKSESLGIISTSKYTSYNIMKNQSPSFKNAVEMSLYIESPLYDTFSWSVLNALSLHLIDSEKARQLLYDASDKVKADLNVMS